MAPMMEPRPQLFNKKKAKERAEAAARQVADVKRRAAIVRVVLASVLGGAGLGLMLWFGLKSVPTAGPAQRSSAPTLEKALESGDDWFAAARDGGAGERMKKILKENPRLEPGHRVVKAGRVVIKLRTLDGQWGPAPAEGQKTPSPPPPEGGAASGGSPAMAAPPPPTDAVTE
jgi:hypothetical protein